MRPTMRVVAVKTAEQQAAVLLHRGREVLVCQRTGLLNALRGHLAVQVVPEAGCSVCIIILLPCIALLKR